MFDCYLVVRGAARISTPDERVLPVPAGTDVIDLTTDFTPGPVVLVSPLSFKSLATNAATWLARSSAGSTAVTALRSFSKAVATIAKITVSRSPQGSTETQFPPLVSGHSTPTTLPSVEVDSAPPPRVVLMFPMVKGSLPLRSSSSILSCLPSEVFVS